MKERGCGTRVIGGVYAESRLSSEGQSIEHFLIDPPAKLPVGALGISQIGVHLINRGGVFHVFDWVGEDSYPNVADFVEEVKHMGASRRLPRSLAFGQLTAQSHLILLHRRAYIDNHRDFYAAATSWDCPKNLRSHQDEHTPSGPVPPKEMCAGLWWHDVTGGLVPVTAASGLDGRTSRAVTRRMPAFDYEALRAPVRPEYTVAAFMSLPITNLAVIRDPDNDSHLDPLDRASAAQGIPVVLEDA